jgi:hypothetical protein
VRATATGTCERTAPGAAWVRKLGNRFIAYDHDNHLIGDADPGFKPTPEDAEWAEKVEYERAHDLEHPYYWPRLASAGPVWCTCTAKAITASTVTIFATACARQSAPRVKCKS